MMMMMMMISYSCVQEKDMAQFELKYNESMTLLEDAVSRLTDNLARWRDQWRRLSDSEKSALCSKSSPRAPELVNSQHDVVVTPPQPRSAEGVDSAAAMVRSVRTKYINVSYHR